MGEITNETRTLSNLHLLMVRRHSWRCRELLTKQLVRDLDASGVCPPGKERDIAQRLVALAKENHENLVRK